MDWACGAYPFQVYGPITGMDEAQRPRGAAQHVVVVSDGVADASQHTG